ncbi:uncharacterized protein LOC106161155 [Lingula anatina]|uniref:Uncharacterized protein LOC106161155 n=1 Tax=Lingula anatina TaxID=7574 RepID=A0A1S3I7X7_LINAN|nr:uncharacterized protein LOC106161155 [Lingula anatina]|eukprot:XP_013393479.1 uncharacterized protein LOC106161155 [Lingula anatina]
MSAPMASRIGKYLILSRQFINRGHVLSSNAQIIPVRFKTKQDKGKDKGGEKSRWMIRQEEKRKKLKAEKKKEKSESTLKFGALECPYPNEMYKKRIPVDPVWSPRHYPVQFSTHSVEKSLEMHRELADPSMMDDMNKYVHLELRFDTEITKEVMVKGGKKETKVSYLESISDYLKFPHMFETKEKRRVMVFCKPEEVELALSNGAEIAGGKELADQTVVLPFATVFGAISVRFRRLLLNTWCHGGRNYM